MYALHRVLNARFPDRNMEKEDKMTFVMLTPRHTSGNMIKLEYNGHGGARQCFLPALRVQGEIKADMKKTTEQAIRENYETLLRADALLKNRFYIVRVVLQQCLEQPFSLVRFIYLISAASRYH